MTTLNNLLIIEDELFQLNWLHELCKPLAKNVLLAQDGAEALKMIAAQGMPDALICDLNMSGMDGVTFLRHLANDDDACPVLLLSAASADIIHSVVEMATLQGVFISDALSKPVSRQQISECLQQLPLVPPCPMPRGGTVPPPDRQMLEQALSQQQIRPYFQPQICVETGRLIGVEALARWEHPQHGILSPAYFIDPMYQHALIDQLGEHILEQSIIRCRQWLDQGVEVPVSVNIAPSELLDVCFADRVFALLDRHGLPGHLLCLEITETEGYDDLSRLLETSARLRLHGIKLAIDDFGTGHSSLLHLVQSPVSELKIDRIFVANMLEDSRYRSAVHASLAMARHLRIHTVAEGVETQAQAQMLKEMGCDSLQGFYFSPAIGANELIRWNQQRLALVQ
ncbi:EAL domain-containing protein [Pseudaeromonas sharmana]|uniref:EAL domain-containing protein n=1 Tax=Pseudaeromonas sharmana TaxID=328412 RepID=A0ABV8CPT0_9GAMM